MIEKDVLALPVVPYESLRDALKTGDLLFASGSYAFSKTIQKFSKSAFSHVGVVAEWGGRKILLESVEIAGVRAIPVSTYLSDYDRSGKAYKGKVWLARRKAVTVALGEKLIDAGCDLLGRKYDMAEAAAMAMRLSTGVGRHKDDEPLLCSEFVQACFQAVGLAFPTAAGGFVYPGTIAGVPEVSALGRVL